MTGAEFLPQTRILPQVDLVITHGGNNTTTEAFFFGKPMIVLPLFWDQYDNAQRVDELGYGVRLSTYGHDGEELRGAIDRLLADDALQRTADGRLGASADGAGHDEGRRPDRARRERLTEVAFEAERWYADRGRSPVRVETLDSLGALELVRVEFAEGEPALYTLLRDEPQWAQLFAEASGAFVADGERTGGRRGRARGRPVALVLARGRRVRQVLPSARARRASGGRARCRARRGRPGARASGSRVAALGRTSPLPSSRTSWTGRRRGGSGPQHARWPVTPSSPLAVGRVARRVHDVLRREFPTRESTRRGPRRVAPCGRGATRGGASSRRGSGGPDPERARGARARCSTSHSLASTETSTSASSCTRPAASS